MERNPTRSLRLAAIAGVAMVVGFAPAVAAAGNQKSPAAKQGLNGGVLMQLENLRKAMAPYMDVAAAEAAGYADIGVFVPGMGWHYVKQSLVDDRFEAYQPEALVFADDPCGGPRRLVAVEYIVPESLVTKAPSGFVGKADTWVVNPIVQAWTLHAWIYEYNVNGVFAPTNPRVP